ncbi:MAG: ABC transporter permease, partial [Lachnospiraceae bacterium]|nr:ABC transporter permease [Lachnospiraceae bacterium]
IGFPDTAAILPAVLVQTAILSLIMALTGFGCTMILKDFRQFSLAYVAVVIIASALVFLSANTSVKMSWIDWHPFYQVYMGLKNACFGTPVTTTGYYLCSACGIVMLYLIVQTAFHREMGKEG